LFQTLSIKALSDEELIKNYCQRNDNKFLGELFSRYIRFVFLVCMKYLKDEELSKDISMQVFEKLSDDLKRFEVKNFKSWLHVVAKNACYAHFRADRHFTTVSISDKNDALKSMENIPDLHHNNDHELRIEQLEKAITMLDHEQKQCIELFFLKGKPYKEVAEITGFSTNQVKSHIQNGKRNLKNYMIANGEILLLVFMSIYFS
jgi:RNA polymerase sigma factor (sigma-70 family)